MQEALFDAGPDPVTTGWVYVFGPHGSSTVKIGTAVDAEKRLTEIQTGNPERLVIQWKTPGGRGLERWLHGRFQEHRKLGEWFNFGDLDPVKEIRSAVESLGTESRYRPSEFGCHIIPPIRYTAEGTSFTFYCPGTCGNTWRCFD